MNYKTVPRDLKRSSQLGTAQRIKFYCAVNTRKLRIQ